MSSTSHKSATGPAPTMVVQESHPSPLTPTNEQDESLNVLKVDDEQKLKNTVVFNKDADLLFKVKTRAGFEHLKVNKFNVSSASDAFSRLLFETNSGADMIELSDDPTAFATLLHVIHYNFGQVPKQPSMNELFEICVVSSKYNCTHLLAPWSERWAAVLVEFTNSKMAAESNYKALWASWVLGCVAPFQSMADSLILTSKVDSAGELVQVSGLRLKDLILPLDLFDRIVEIRSQTITSILAEIQKSIELLINKKSASDNHFCKIGSDATECEMMLLASALMLLIPTKLFPVPESDTFTLSVADLKSVVYGIHYRAWIGRDHAPHKAHSACNLGLKDIVKTILDQMPSILQHAHMDHLYNQAGITGVDNGDAFKSFQTAAALEDQAEDQARDDNKTEVPSIATDADISVTTSCHNGDDSDNDKDTVKEGMRAETTHDT